jgi:carbon-monoxide dehydrogenase medium subunit
VSQFVTGPFQNALAYDEIAVEAVIPAPRGTVDGGYLKLERRVGDFATAGVAVAIERSGAAVTRAGIALTGVGGATICHQAAEALVGAAHAATSRGRRAAARPPSPDHHRGCYLQGQSRTSSSASRPASNSHQRRQPDMSG